MEDAAGLVPEVALALAMLMKMNDGYQGQVIGSNKND